MMELESILKKYPRSVPTVSVQEPPERSRSPSKNARKTRDLELALNHANMIEERKIVENENFAALEELIDFPLSTIDSAVPSREDVAGVRKLIKAFQRSDYDDLIEERHAAEKCGYVLCPRPHKSEDRRPGQLKLVWNHRNMKSVPLDKVDVWCSNDCKKMAMHIKLQLSEIPAWDRMDSGAKDLTIIGESSEDRSSDIENALADLSLRRRGNTEEEKKSDTVMTDLSTDQAIQPAFSRALLMPELKVCERAILGPPRILTTITSPMEIEGYTPEVRNVMKEINKLELEEDAKHDDDWNLG